MNSIVVYGPPVPISMTLLTDTEVSTAKVDDVLVRVGKKWVSKNIQRAISDVYSVVLFDKSDVIVEDTEVSNTVDEGVLFSSMIIADTLSVGSTIKTEVDGMYSTGNSNVTFMVKVKINGVIIHQFTSVPKNVTDTPVALKISNTVRDSGVVVSKATFSAPSDGLFAAVMNDTTIDMSIDNLLEITMQWDEASVANTGTIRQGMLRIYK
jgi:hypothetical protein